MAKPLIACLMVLAAACVPARTAQAQVALTPRDSADLRVWREFVAVLQAGPLPDERLSPYLENLRNPLRGFLATMRASANWSEWHRTPQQFRVGKQLHFLAPLTFDGQTATYCFSFLTDSGGWKFQHLEAITIRLDQLGPLPVTRFPDLPERDKFWMREELDIGKDAQWLRTLTAEKGQATALTWFADGAGYALAARAWVPFVSPDRAFILYLCWEQARLHGTEVTLQTLDPGEAVVRLRTIYFLLYAQSAHLKQQIPLADYRRLFEYRWQDRARNAGWSLAISYDGDDAILRFVKPPAGA